MKLFTDIEDPASPVIPSSFRRPGSQAASSATDS